MCNFQGAANGVARLVAAGKSMRYALGLASTRCTLAAFGASSKSYGANSYHCEFMPIASAWTVSQALVSFHAALHRGHIG